MKNINPVFLFLFLCFLINPAFSSTNPGEALNSAETVREKGLELEALRLYSRLISDFPESRQAQEALQALKLPPLQIEYIPELEEALEEANKYCANDSDEARVILRRLLSEYPDKEPVLRNRIAATYFAQRSYSTAREEYGKIIRDYPDTLQALTAKRKIIQSYYMERSFREAVKQAEEFISEYRKKDYPDKDGFYRYHLKNQLILTQLTLARSLRRLTRFNEAAEAYEVIVRQYPDSPVVPQAMREMGECYYFARQYHEALAVFEQITQRYPNTHTANIARQNIVDIEMQVYR